MLRFDVNLSILFADLPLLERPSAAAAAGFAAVELWWPFADAAPPRDAIDDLVDAIGSAGLTLACLNFDAGDFAAGQRGLVCDRALRARFRENVPVAVDLAGRLGCRVLNALYGNAVRGEGGPPDGGDTAIENLAFAARSAAAVGATVVLEALNEYDYPAYTLRTVAEAGAVAEQVTRETGAEIGLLFDVYHVARSGQDVVAGLALHRPSIRHVQLADSPGRGRPGTGRLDVAGILAALEVSGYEGYVGLEYEPSADRSDTFTWLRDTAVPGRPLLEGVAPSG